MMMSANRKWARRRRGLTLIEALATVLVLGIALPGVMYALSMCTKVSGYARHKAEATTLADSKLSDLLVTGNWQQGVASGDFGADGPGYRWQMDKSDWQEVGMAEVRVAVLWMDNDTEREVDVSTLVYATSAATTQASAVGGGQ